METKMSKKDILIRDMKREGMVMDGIQVRKKKSIEKLRDLEVAFQAAILAFLLATFFVYIL